MLSYVLASYPFRLLSQKSRTADPYSQALISRLPVEIVHIIFWIIADSDNPHLTNPHLGDPCYGLHCKKASTPSWLRLGHVCATWRAIVMDMSALWARDALAFGWPYILNTVYSRVKPVPPHALDTVLARAKAAPLGLFSRPDTAHNSFILISLLLPRAGTLCVVLKHGEGRSLVNALRSQPLPLLQILSIDKMAGILEPRNTKDGRFEVLDGLTALHTLKLSKVYLHPPLSGRLVELRILHPPPSLPRPTLDEILNVMAHNPALVRLALHHAFGEQHSWKAVRSVLVMSKLAELDLMDAAYIINDFFDAVETPSLKHVFVDTANPSRGSTVAYKVLTKALSACHLVSDPTSPSKLALSLHTSKQADSLKISVFDNQQASPKSRRFYFNIGFPQQDITTDVIVRTAKAFADAQASYSIRELVWINSLPQCDTEGCWDAITASFKNVEKIRFPAWPPTAGASRSLASPDSDGNPRLPHLRQVLTHANWSIFALFAGCRVFKHALRLREDLGAAACSLKLSYDSWQNPELWNLLNYAVKARGLTLTNYRCENGEWRYVIEFDDQEDVSLPRSVLVVFDGAM